MKFVLIVLTVLSMNLVSGWAYATSSGSSTQSEEVSKTPVQAEEAFLEIAEDHKVYYRYQKAEKGQPTVVLMNGLIYAIENQDEYFTELVKKGVGVLQVAYSTQPESLRSMKKESPYYSKAIYHILYGWIQRGLETQDLVDEVMAVVDFLKIEKFGLITLSYGSIPGIELAAQNVDRVEHLILMAPAVVTSGRYNSYGASRHLWYETLKASGNGYADYFYDAEIGNTLSLLLTPAKYSFVDVEFKDFYSGVYQMARSSKWFDLKNYVYSELPPTSIFVATMEDRPLYQDQEKFWDLMSENPSQKSRVVFEGSYHAIPGVAPEAAAEQTVLALTGKLKKESSVKVGTGNHPETIRESLLDYSELSPQDWENAQ